MDATAGERESEDCPRAEDGENGGHFRTDFEKVSRVERTAVVQGELPTKKTAAKFCLVSSETAMHPVSRSAKKRVKNIIGVSSSGKFDAGQLRRH